MNIRTATRTAAAAAALILAGVSLAACASASPSVAEEPTQERPVEQAIEPGFYESPSDGHRSEILYVTDELKIVRASHYVAAGETPEEAAAEVTARDTLLADIVGDDFSSDGAPRIDIKERSDGVMAWEYAYHSAEFGEITDDNAGVIWDDDITDIDDLALNTPVKGTFTIANVIYEPLAGGEE